MDIIKTHKNIYSVKKIFLIGLTIIVFSSCTSVVRFSGNRTESNKNKTTETSEQSNVTGTFRGLASYYHDKFEGKQTSSGEIFSQQKFTAAHKTLPFGTMVRVTRISNQKQVTVKINDRGPFVADRIIDLSSAAAKELGLINDGVAEVIIEVIK